MKKISVNIITNRKGGIDAQLHYFAQQTVKDFEMVIVDELWEERHDAIENLIKQLNMDVTYLKPRRHLDNIVMGLHAMARNEALTYVDAEYVLFFDDYQIPTDNLIAEHLHHLSPTTAVVGQQINLNKMDIFHPDLNNVKALDSRNINNGVTEIPYAWYWTSNASAPMNAIIAMNGVDERFNAGSGGEDYSGIGLPLTKQNIKIVYVPNALCYHIDHDGIPQAKDVPKKITMEQHINMFRYRNHDHNLAPFVKNPYHNGDANLMESEQFKCWRDKWNIKHYYCKLCGVEGVCDSLETHNIKLKEDTYVAPIELFDLKRAREQFKKENRNYMVSKKR